MKRILFLVIGLSLLPLLAAAEAQAQSRAPRPGPSPDPIEAHLFPPELVMQHQRMLALTEAQRTSIKEAVQAAQLRFVGLQWDLQSAMETLQSLLAEARPDEARVLSQLDTVLDLERQIKRTQITLGVRIKNLLSAEQKAQLQAVRTGGMGEG